MTAQVSKLQWDKMNKELQKRVLKENKIEFVFNELCTHVGSHYLEQFQSDEWSGNLCVTIV